MNATWSNPKKPIPDDELDDVFDMVVFLFPVRFNVFLDVTDPVTRGRGGGQCDLRDWQA